MTTFWNVFIINGVEWDLQDGRGVRRGDHLPPHKYIKKTSTCGTTTTEHLLNAGRRPQTSQKARNSPTYLGRAKEKRKNRDERIGMGPAHLGGSCEGGNVSTHKEAPSLVETRGVVGGASEPWRRAQPQGCRGQSREIPAQKIGADQHSPACKACVLTHRGWWGLGAEAQVSDSYPDARERTGVGCMNTA